MPRSPAGTSPHTVATVAALMALACSGDGSIERRPQHDERHGAARTGIAPAVPVAQLHHDVTLSHHPLAFIQDEHSFTLHDDPVIDRLRLVDRGAEGVLSAAVPGC